MSQLPASIASAPTIEGTLDDLATYLTDGYWTRRHFDTDDGSNAITVNITALGAEGQQLARWAFEAWEMMVDVDFVEIGGAAEITFSEDQAGSFGGAILVNSDGTIKEAIVNVDENWLSEPWGGTGIDSFSFFTYIHEIGHALGLGHQGPYDGGADYDDALFTNDSRQISVMSYFWQTENPTVDASLALPLTAMMADIIAIQSLYGAPGTSSVTAGDTVWGAGTNLGGYLGALFDFYADGSGSEYFDEYYPSALTLYDRNGTDLIDLSFSTMDNRLDLNGASFSDIEGGTGNIAIARDTLIENATMGAGNDTVTGNGAANLIDGGAGNDSLLGGAGFDTLVGGAGNDTIDGGFGRDIAFLGDGDDVYLDTGQGNPLGRDTVWAGNGNDIVDTGAGDDLIFGLNGQDILRGGTGHDAIYGGNQGDRIYAGAGNDTVDGGNGRDTAYLGNGNDLYTDTGQAGWLGGNRIFGGNGDDTITGANGDDSLHGGNNNDVLAGIGGNDLIFGGAGFDQIYAGAGNDTVEAGHGRDTVFLGNGNDRFDDSGQTGWWGGDRVFGGAGDDTIEGGAGEDILTGGSGADEFILTGTTFEHDIITDFEIGIDGFQLDDALWGGGLSASEVIGHHASVTADGLLLDFGGGNSLLFAGLTTVTGLENDLTIV